MGEGAGGDGGPGGLVSDWRDRFRGVADAQTRYLYLLGAAGIFFFVLHLALAATPTTVVLGVPVSARIVWATGPAVLGFLLAACGGTISAMGHAHARMALASGEFEREDVKPNALDMVGYTTDASPNWAKAVAGLTYGVYVALFMVEGVWLWWLLLHVEGREPVLTVALVVGAVMLLLGAVQPARVPMSRSR